MKVKLNGVRKIPITGDHIKLDSLLKYASIAPTGGIAKFMISSGEVTVNNEICTQRGKKITPNQIVKYGNEILLISKRDP